MAEGANLSSQRDREEPLTLDPERWRIIGPHLDRALDLPEEERGPWLAALRSQDPDLAAELEALLENHDALSREDAVTGDAPARPERTTLAGLVIGAYTLRTPLGHGGMGQVWLAERSDGRFEGTAAVKILNASLIGNEGEARFRREGRLLARLRHPCIAQLIDAGMTSLGQPYLILEHIDGEPIDAYCDTRNLPIDERIKMFLSVLSAVAFAHNNLVVHRDLKPPNILVGKDGRAKLLDFGIAKLVDPDGERGVEATLTREGESAMTLAYAAPEQLNGGAITTATDVYALGVVLYVLLTGQHPAGSDTASPVMLIKAIVDREAPRPSDAVVTGTLHSQEDLAGNASRRAGNPRKLRRRLQGDLDNIVAKALRKQPRERYPSVESMAEDLRRYLNNEPVSARAASLAYRAEKFVRRNRGGVAAAALVLAAVMAGTVGVAWQAREARQQRDAAEAQLSRATAANDFTAYLLGVAAPTGEKFTVGELLDKGEALIEKMYADDDVMRAEMLIVIGHEYLLSEQWEKARPILERAAGIVEHLQDPGLRARAHCPLSLLKMFESDRAGAEVMIGRALDDLPAAPQYDLQRAECLTRRSEFGFVTGDGAVMIRYASEARELLARSRGATVTQKIDALGALAYGYYLARQNAQAERTFAEVMQALEQVGRGRTIMAAETLNNWSLVYYLGEIARAEPLLRRAIEIRRSIEAGGSIGPTNTFNLAGVLLRLGRYAEAEALYEETIRIATARQAMRTELDATMELAELQIEKGDLPRATAQLERLKPLEGTPQFDQFRHAQLAYYRGRIAQARGDQGSARSQYAEAVGFFESRKEKIAMNVDALIGLARAEQALGDLAAASAAAARALSLAESFVEPGAPSYLVGLALVARGEVLTAERKPDAAAEAFASAARHLERTLGPDHQATKDALRRTAS